MQYDPHTRHYHVLIFETQDAAYAAHALVMSYTGSMFLEGEVLKGGKRRSIFLSGRQPAGTWRYVFVTMGPIPNHLLGPLLLAAGADSAQWNALWRAQLDR